jgi:hypothetical protein
MHPNIVRRGGLRKCGLCGRLIRVRVLGTLASDSKPHLVTKDTRTWELSVRGAYGNGLQSYCVECNAMVKRSHRYAFKNFLRADGIDYAFWNANEELFLEILFSASPRGAVVPLCAYCGAHIFQWAGGYGIDKRFWSIGYEPDNMTPACWPCNVHKGRKSVREHQCKVDSLYRDYGYEWGRIDWTRHPHPPGPFKTYPRVILPQYIEQHPQMNLGLG